VIGLPKTQEIISTVFFSSFLSFFWGWAEGGGCGYACNHPHEELAKFGYFQIGK